jgi:hypothetical protein
VPRARKRKAVESSEVSLELAEEIRASTTAGMGAELLWLNSEVSKVAETPGNLNSTSLISQQLEGQLRKGNTFIAKHIPTALRGTATGNNCSRNSYNLAPNK